MKMKTVTQLHIYLPSPMREDAAAGRVNIVNRIATAIAPSGWKITIHPDTERSESPGRDGYALLHMQEPTAPNELCLRRAYHYPFWQIEATNERWEFDVALAEFGPEMVDPAESGSFFRRWGAKLLGGVQAKPEDFIFMPLQGRLLHQRSFQSMSPIRMIAATLEVDRGRKICATLHPKEVYTLAEIDALEDLSRRFPRFQLVNTEATLLLSACRHVVTQNSSLALTGFFAQKPAVLFAKIDFHHIAGSVPRDGLEAAFARASEGTANHAAYLYWFWKLNCINGGAAEAESQILSRFRRHGWAI